MCYLGKEVAVACLVLVWAASEMRGAELPPPVSRGIAKYCLDCHQGPEAKGDLDLTTFPFDLKKQQVRDRWIMIHDRVQRGEMPPAPVKLPEQHRDRLVQALAKPLVVADRAAIEVEGRGSLRRLNRLEYEHNLRDLLQLPHLDIRDQLPLDPERHHCDKVAAALDLSRVQLGSYLNAAERALREAVVREARPAAEKIVRVFGTQLGPRGVAGGPECLFFLRNARGVDLDHGQPRIENHPEIEMGLFRSPSWPYSVIPAGVIAPRAGEYRVRFSARAVVQEKDFLVKRGTRSVPVTFRARKPTDHDIAEEVRLTGGILDVEPDGGIYETVVYLRAGQTIEYGLLGLPSPQIDAEGRTGYYRYPPFPEGGQPGVAFKWVEMSGPILSETWPPVSQQVLFGELGIDELWRDEEASVNAGEERRQSVGVAESEKAAQAQRLLQRFIRLAAREPVPAEALPPFEELVAMELARGEPLGEALLTGYQAFLCSDLFLYLREPLAGDDQFALANRLSHFLTDSRPDEVLAAAARGQRLRDPVTLRQQMDRLLAGDRLRDFVKHFTDSWLGLQDLHRDAPHVRLYPEYRLDDYLVDSMGRETRAFFTAMLRDNLSVRVLVDADFAFVNDRLARHYALPPVEGSAMRRVALPEESPYGGLLTQASVLKLSADGTNTSPVLRGVWMMDRLLGQPPPPPPPGIPAVEPDIRGANTMRDLIAQHTAAETCARCHEQFDPLGLALENFDVLGRWRARYRGLEVGERVVGIDRAGHDFSYTLASAVDGTGELADGRNFEDVHELKRLLRTDTRTLARNLLQQFTVYATGTPVRFGDRPEIKAILERCAPDGYRVGDLLRELVLSRIFTGSEPAKEGTAASLSSAPQAKIKSSRLVNSNRSTEKGPL